MTSAATLARPPTDPQRASLALGRGPLVQQDAQAGQDDHGDLGDEDGLPGRVLRRRSATAVTFQTPVTSRTT